MIIRPGTRKEFREFLGKVPEQTVRGYVCEIDGEIMAVGGWYYTSSEAVAFTDVKPGMRKRDIIKAARIFVEKLKELKVEVLVQAKNPTSCEHFGFRQYNDTLWKLEK